MNKDNKPTEGDKYSVTISDWLQFLQNTKTTDIHVMISVAALITAIAAIAFGIAVFSIENLSSGLIITISVIVVLLIGLTAYYFIESRTLGTFPPRKEFKKAQGLINEIIAGKINDSQKIRKKWLEETKKKK